MSEQNYIELSTKSAFQDFVSSSPSVLQRICTSISNRITEKSNEWTHTTPNKAPMNHAKNVFLSETHDLNHEDKINVLSMVISNLVLFYLDKIDSLRLPDEALALFPAAYKRVLRDLNKVQNEKEIENALYVINKHLRFITLMTVPFGLYEVDLRDRYPIKSALIGVVREKRLKPILDYFKLKGNGIWLRSHLNTDYLREFNEKGIHNYHLRIAEYLRNHPEVKGLGESSWFFDPQVAKISPKLAFLSSPTLKGACLLKHKSTDVEIKFATHKSETRKRLYEEGKYLPTQYSQYWSRKDILDWADKQKEITSQ